MTKVLSKSKIPHFKAILGPGASLKSHLMQLTPPMNLFYHVKATLKKLRETD